jgi:transcriptional regulator with XRE-family HTH domain
MSQAELARALDATPPAIQQILSGRTKTSRLLPRMAQYFRVNEEWLNGTSDSRFANVTGSMTPDQLVSELKLRLAGGRIHGTLDDGEVKSEGFPFCNDVFDPYWLMKEVSLFDGAAASRNDEDYIPPVITVAIGTDAMSPTISKGDEVTISLSTTKVTEAEAIWYLSYGGLRMIRRLMPLPSGGYHVSADNPRSPSFDADASDVTILGRAFWLGRRIS